MAKTLCGWLGAAVIAAAGAPAQAQQAANGAPPLNDPLYSVPKVPGAVPWELLVNLEMVYEGVDLVPEFGADVRALVGEEVKMVGFLLPLDAARTRLLLSMYSPACPYHLAGSPETMVELIADEPIEFSDEAVVVTGRFELLDDWLAGYYYRLTDVTRIAEESS